MKNTVIPSENASPARAEGSRYEALRVAQRDSSAPLRYARNDNRV